jgi:hypothetical protein
MPDSNVSLLTAIKYPLLKDTALNAFSNVTQSRVSRNSDFTLFIPRTVRNQLATLRPTKRSVLLLRYLHYDVTLNIPTCFDPQLIIIREGKQSITA